MSRRDLMSLRHLTSPRQRLRRNDLTDHWSLWRPDRRAALGALACFGMVAVLGLTVRGGPAAAADHWLAARTHAWVIAHPPWPRIAEITGTITMPWTFRILALLASLVLVLRRHTRTAAWLLVTVSIGSVASVVLKLAFARPRPAWADPIVTIGGNAFPSGHAVNAAVAAGCVIALAARFSPGCDTGQVLSQRRALSRQYAITRAAQAVAVLIALTTGLGRVLLGVHYPLDVVAGWLTGAGVVLALCPVWRENPRETADPGPAS